jgi:Na+/H+-dicarboxylate symporter
MILSKKYGDRPMKFWIKMIAGLVIGIIVGIYITPSSLFYEPFRVIGLLFFRLMGFLVLPLLLASGIRCAINLRTGRRLLIVIAKTMAYFLLLTVVGSVIGITLGHALKPGIGINIAELESPMVINYPDTSSFILGVVPQGWFAFIRSEYAVLSIVFIAFLIAVGIILARDEADEFHSLIISIDNTFHRINGIVLEFLPMGIFAYIGYTMGSFTVTQIMPFLKLILVVVAGCFIQVFIVQAMLVYATTRTNPFKFIHAILSSCILGYVSGNRHTAYPVLVYNIEHNLGADRETFTFVAGLGLAFSLSGSAIASGVATQFVAQIYGLDLSIYLEIIIVLLITVATLKLDGIHEGGLVLLSIVLSRIIKLPAEGYALILGIAAIIYQIETVVNVSGNACVSYIIAHSEDAVAEVALKDFI